MSIQYRASVAEFVHWRVRHLKTGCEPIVIELVRRGDEMVTDVAAIAAAIERYGAASIVAVMSTTSCFAPRACDDVVGIAQLCSATGVPHLVNHAYGLQASKLCAVVDEACRLGRVDAWVASTDKNFLVPVGGALVGSPTPAVVEAVARSYPGRAALSPILDLFVTLLQLGVDGLMRLLAERKVVATELKARISALAARHGERLLESRGNPISFAMSIDCITQRRPSGGLSSPDSSAVFVSTAAVSSTPTESRASGASASPPSPKMPTIIGVSDLGVATPPKPTAAAAAQVENETYLGAMLFSRGVSGTRVVTPTEVRRIDKWTFRGYGAQCDDYPCAYITAAAAIGMTLADVETYCVRLESTIKEYQRKLRRGHPAPHSSTSDASASGVVQAHAGELRSMRRCSSAGDTEQRRIADTGADGAVRGDVS